MRGRIGAIAPQGSAEERVWCADGDKRTNLVKIRLLAAQECRWSRQEKVLCRGATQ